MIRLVLLRILESYFRHRWLYLLPTVLLVGVAGASFATKTDVYIASSTFYAQDGSFLSSLTTIRQAGFSWVTPAQTAVNELRQLKGTNAFVRAVVQQTELEEELHGQSVGLAQTLDGVRNDIWFQVMGDNLVMVLGSHENPDVARQLVEATINSYIQWQINADREESVSTQTFFSNLISAYQTDLETARDELRDYLAANPEPVRGSRPEIEQMEIERLQTAVTLADTRLLSAMNSEESARLGMTQAESDARQTYFVIDAAKTPTQPASSKADALTQSLIFIVVGVMMSVIGIVGGGILDRSFRFAIDVHHLIDLPVLAQVPAPPQEKKRGRNKKKKAADAEGSDA